jgi:tetratricopeptide (TPR) repeat protein
MNSSQTATDFPERKTSVRVAGIEVPTYAPGPSFSLPACSCLRRQELYPYAPQRDLSSVCRPMRHRVVVLENRYLRAEVLPDIGGRLYRLFDKTANRDVFEYTGVFKYQNIGNRGAWLSGGIEFNFGFHGHTNNTTAPVSWATRQDPDGGASVWVGAVVMPTESRWALRIGLRPDRAVLDLEIHTMAPPMLPGLVYWWSNAAVEVTDGSAFYYFGKHANDLHRRHSWPFCEGTDLRWYRNRLLGSDMFLMDCDRDGMAFYDFNRDAGVADVADRFAAPGQKYFTWGNAPDALYRDLLFSDTPGHAYAEIQRGRNATQGDADSIPPMTEDSWDEHWLPLHRTRGFSAAQNDLVLSVAADGQGGCALRLVGLRDLRNLTVQAWAQEKPLGTWLVARAAPDAMFVQPLAGAACTRVQVADATGTTLLDWTEYAFDTKDWQKQGFADPLPGPDTTDKLFAQAEKARFLVWPRESQPAQALYDQILAADSGHVGARRALAEIAFHKGDYAKTIEHIQAALPRAPLHADLLALLGWAHFRRRDDAAALAAFSLAARNEPGRRRGLFGLAWLHLRAGRLSQAEEAVSKLLQWNPADKWGRLLRAMLCRQTGHAAEAAAIVQRLQDDDPLWAPVAAEALLLNLPSRLGNGDRRLADDTSYAAAPYIELARWDDAATLLQHEESNEPFSPAVRLAHLLFVLRNKGDARGVQAALTQLRAAPVEQAHPWTTVALDLLRQLAEWYPDEPLVQILLGNALAGRGFDPEPSWRRAAALGFAHPVLQANLAAIEARRKNHDAATALYLDAARGAPADIGIFLEVDRFLSTVDRQPERAELYDRLPAGLRNRPLVAQRRVMQLLDAEQYDLALADMDRTTFYRGEWDASLRSAFHEALLGLALPLIQKGNYTAATKLLLRGLEYPRNMNIGRVPDAPNETMIRFWLGVVAAMDRRPDDARTHWIAAQTEPLYAGGVCEIFAMFAAHALGDMVTARRMAAAIEQTVRGERQPHAYFQYFNGGGAFAFHTGMLNLIRSRFDEARQAWADGLANYPHFRFLRLHLRHVPDDLLRRMVKPN